MTMMTRREWLASSALAAAAAAYAKPLNQPIGLQVYTLRAQLPGHVEEILTQVAAMGYEAVEISDPFYGMEIQELAPILKKLKLKAPAGHYGAPKDNESWKKLMDNANLLSVRYMITGFPQELRETADGWKKAGDYLNKVGEQCQKQGLKAAYHNHHFEYKEMGGEPGYDILLRSTDPKLVTMEMDCFWTVFAGKDPVAYFEKYPGRFELLHIKDCKKGYKPQTGGKVEGNPFLEVGQGIIDWKRLFKAARAKAGTKQYFVEQDRCDRPPIEAIKMSVDYLKKLKA